jgi:S-adenosylmethionine-diacylglycerol 3-amino-3-carboxypropyl transferase
VEEGVLYAGRWERHFRLLSQAVGWARPRLRRRLVDCHTLDEQAVVWDRWSRGAWSPFLRVATTRVGWRHVLRDPAFYEHVPPDFSVAIYIAESLNRAAGSFLFRDSAFATLLVFGRYCADGALPLYLRREHFETVRAGLDSLRIVDGSLADALTDDEDRFSAFSLSDVGSYCDDAQYRQLWASVLRSAAPGARVCERQFLVKRKPVLGSPDVLRREPEIEAALTREDRSIFYTFVVGHLNGQSHA